MRIPGSVLINALLALGVRPHLFHGRAIAWLGVLASAGTPAIATCAITELGARQYGLSLAEGRELLLALKAAVSVRFVFIPDDHDISRLPRWVKSPNQTTDGHLLERARAHGARLATLDEHIEGAHVIPSNG